MKYTVTVIGPGGAKNTVCETDDFAVAEDAATAYRPEYAGEYWTSHITDNATGEEVGMWYIHCQYIRPWRGEAQYSVKRFLPRRPGVKRERYEIWPHPKPPTDTVENDIKRLKHGELAVKLRYAVMAETDCRLRIVCLTDDLETARYCADRYAQSPEWSRASVIDTNKDQLIVTW